MRFLKQPRLVLKFTFFLVCHEILFTHSLVQIRTHTLFLEVQYKTGNHTTYEQTEIYPKLRSPLRRLSWLRRYDWHFDPDKTWGPLVKWGWHIHRCGPNHLQYLSPFSTVSLSDSFLQDRSGVSPFWSIHLMALLMTSNKGLGWFSDIATLTNFALND